MEVISQSDCIAYFLWSIDSQNQQKKEIEPLGTSYTFGNLYSIKNGQVWEVSTKRAVIIPLNKP